MKKKILFITPSLARTGSEMVLWYLLTNLDRDKFTPYIFCLKRGELFDQIPTGFNKSIAYRKSGSWYKKVFRGLLKAFGVEPIGYQLKQIQNSFNADLWYVNTILIPQAHLAAKQKNVRIVTHFHELMFAFSFIKSKEFQDIINYSDLLIGCSKLVCEQLANVGHANIKLQNSFIDEQYVNVDRNRVTEIRKKLGITDADFVWVISGTVAFMKGLDDVIKIAEHFKNSLVKIIWVGGEPDNGLSYYMRHVALNKYPGKLMFTGNVGKDYYNYLSIANSLLLLSKEESFSLVMLEAAYLGIPIVAYNVGMAKDFIKEGMGRVVDNFNIGDMIVGMDYLHQNPEQDIELLKRAVKEYTISVQLPHFEKLLEEN